MSYNVNYEYVGHQFESVIRAFTMIISPKMFKTCSWSKLVKLKIQGCTFINIYIGRCPINDRGKFLVKIVQQWDLINQNNYI